MEQRISVRSHPHIAVCVCVCLYVIFRFDGSFGFGSRYCCCCGCCFFRQFSPAHKKQHFVRFRCSRYMVLVLVMLSMLLLAVLPSSRLRFFPLISFHFDFIFALFRPQIGVCIGVSCNQTLLLAHHCRRRRLRRRRKHYIHSPRFRSIFML